MARTERFIRPGIWVEATRDWNGLSYYAWKPDISRWFGDRKTMLKWLAWPIKTPTGDELRAWLDGLEKATKPAEEPKVETTGLDASDPNFATKTII